jgi:integrase
MPRKLASPIAPIDLVPNRVCVHDGADTAPTTDAIMNGMPPHIAQILLGHKNINTTMG